MFSKTIPYVNKLMIKLYAHHTMQSILNLASNLAGKTLKRLRVWSNDQYSLVMQYLYCFVLASRMLTCEYYNYALYLEQ